MAAKKTDQLVSLAGTFQTTATLLDAAVRKRNGVLSEAVVLLGTPEHAETLEVVADALALACKKHKAAIEASERVRVLSKTAIEVNLATAPHLPFDGATIKHNAGGGWVKVEKKKDGLYVDGKKVELHLVNAQKNGSTIRGHELREALSGLPVLHPNILDALYDHPHLIPEDFKQDEQGRTRFIFFWGVIFCGSGGDLCVRFLYWYDGAWRRYYRWLGYLWDDQRPAAVSAS